MKPMFRERHFESCAPRSFAMSVSPIRMLPRVGWSMPPRRLSSVVLPEPDGPMSATYSPAFTSSVNPASTGTSCASRR